MTKIMKKTLGLALAAVMALTLAPLSAIAAPVGAPVNSPVGDNSYVSGPSYNYVSPSWVYVTGDAYEATDDYVKVDLIGTFEDDEDVVVTNETLLIYIEEAAAAGKELKLPTTSKSVVMGFDAKALKEAGDFELDLTVDVKDDVKDETVAKNNKITKDNFVLKIEFSHDGELPAEATIEVVLPEDIADKYETLYYYQIMEDGTLKFVCDAPVKDGIATVKQDHCSDYVLLTEKIADEKAPKTGDSSNIALWVSVLGLGVVAIAGSAVMKKREF